MITFRSNTYEGRYLELSVDEISTDVVSNTSKLRWTLMSAGGDSGVYCSVAPTYVKIAGQVVYTNPAYPQYQGYTTYVFPTKVGAVSGEATVNHESNGTGQALIELSTAIYYTDSPQYYSDSMALTPIPRASTMSFGEFTIDVDGTISIERASNDFTHTLTYSFGSLSGTVAQNIETSVVFHPPASFYSQLPTSTNDNGTFVLQTFKNGVVIGTSTKVFTVNVSESIKPSVPTISVSPVNTNTWINSKGIYVSGFSRVHVISSATGGAGTTGVSYSISGVGTGEGADWISGVCASEGSKTITVTATDTRGRKSLSSVTIIVRGYSLPTISLKCNRGTYSGGAWQDDDSGAHIRAEASFVLSLTTAGNEATSWTVKIGDSAPDATSNTFYYFTETTAESVYTVTARCVDSVGSVGEKKSKVSTIEVPLNINYELPSVGVGCVANTPKALVLGDAWKLVLATPLPVTSGGTEGSTAEEARQNIGAAPLSHTHDAGDIQGVLPLSVGGLGATTAAGARSNLGLGSVATLSIVPINSGGTGGTTAAGARSNLGLGAVTLWSGSSSSGTLYYSNLNTYSAYVVLGSINNTSAWTCVVIPGNLVSDSAYIFAQLDNDSAGRYINFYVYSNRLVINSQYGGSTVKSVSGII